MTRNKLKVLHVFNSLEPSGAETMLANSADLWDELGIEIGVLATAARPGPYAPSLRSVGYAIHHVHMNTSRLFLRDPRIVLQGVRYLYGLWRVIRRHGYSVVHMHNERGAFYTGLVARLAQRKVVRSIQNVFFFEGLARDWRSVQRAIARSLGVTMVAVSPSVEANEWLRFKNKTTLIPNAVDTNKFRPVDESSRRHAKQALSLPDSSFVVVSVGNCNEVKNHHLILEALANLPERLKWQYLHAGAGEATSTEEQLAVQLQIADRCRFLGRFQDIPRLLHAADAFVMPSRYEGFSLAAIEAVAAGVPAVLADAPGLRDLKNAPCARWVQTESDDIYRALLEISDIPPEDRVRCGIASWSWAREHWDRRRMVKDYASLYGS